MVNQVTFILCSCFTSPYKRILIKHNILGLFLAIHSLLSRRGVELELALCNSALFFPLPSLHLTEGACTLFYPKPRKA